MAVDANVLIYERMREEQRAGKSILASLDAGFHRAWGTIIDSHLTQLIAAMVLYFLGSGPVQGFAVTLALGILTSLFTAYTVTRFFIGMWYRARRPKTLRIQHFRFIPDGTKINFMKISRTVIILSIILTIVSLGSAFFKGFNLGIDFKGGSAIEVQHTAEGPADPARIREVLDKLGLGEVQVQGFGTPEDVLVRIELQPGGDAAQQAAVQKVTETLAAEDYQVRRTEAVSGTVSGELAFNGTIAVLVSMAAILVYVWFRFEWQFALAAITTTTHDVIMTIGLFSITGHRVQPVVDRRGADAGGPVAQRDGGDFRPNSRESSEIQEDAAAGPDQPVDQPDHRPHLAHRLHHLPGADPAGDVRRRGDPRLRHRHDLRRVRRHLFVDHRRRPDPDLLRAQVACRHRQDPSRSAPTAQRSSAGGRTLPLPGPH